MEQVRVPVQDLSVSVYGVPTATPESDGTFEWARTILCVVQASAGGRVGLGYTYADTGTAALIRDHLVQVVRGRDALSVPAAYAAMVHSVRNLGRPGVAAMAISAVDTALWDLKARLCDLPLVDLIGAVRDSAPVYGSGGFTSYGTGQLCEQLAGWVGQGIPRVKMKIGRHPQDDPERVAAARQAIGPAAALFVDANGAYTRKQGLRLAEDFAAHGVTWFEEPVPADDLAGLRLLRDRGPAGMDIAAGEYGYTIEYFRRMLEAGAVDILQADATRCGGITGFLQVGALCEAFGVPLSAHCAPALHCHPTCALGRLVHIEYFYDHARLERMLFDGATEPVSGALVPDRNRPGLGIELKRADAERFAL